MKGIYRMELGEIKDFLTWRKDCKEDWVLNVIMGSNSMENVIGSREENDQEKLKKCICILINFYKRTYFLELIIYLMKLCKLIRFVFTIHLKKTCTHNGHYVTYQCRCTAEVFVRS